MIASHLDTVFPAGTDVRVRRSGTRLMAPGIGDDTHHLAVQLALLRAMDRAGIKTRSDILFVGNVGEETDMRGSRYLVHEGRYAKRIGHFITLDGTDPSSMVRQGVGCRTYRLTLHGPGGHAYGNFGRPNPAFVLGRLIAEFQAIPLTLEPKATLNVGRIGGGTAGNAIPQSVWGDFELRSPDAADLLRMVEAFKTLIGNAIASETAIRTGEAQPLGFNLHLIENISGGLTAEATEIVRYAQAALKSHGFEPRFKAAITDANSAMSVGIPAIMLSAGGPGGGAHTTEEWLDVEPRLYMPGVKSALATILALAGMEIEA